MTMTLQLIDDDGTVLFDFNDSTGANNASAGSIKTNAGVGGAFALGAPEPEQTIISPSSGPGGAVVYRRDPLVQMSWRNWMQTTNFDNFQTAIGTLGRLLAKGGTLKWIADGSTETRYIDFEPSPQPGMLVGDALELQKLMILFQKPEGVTIQVLRQPYLRGSELSPSVNKLFNGTLLIDASAPAGRPDSWTWDSTTNISSESIDPTAEGYQFTIADTAAHNLQQQTGASTFASGNVVTFSFYAKVSSVVGTPQMQATVRFYQSDGTTTVGALQSGGLVTLTTAWQRITVTTAAAGANTSRATCSIQVDNVTAGSTTIQVKNAQAEVASAATPFRVKPITLDVDPSGLQSRMFPVYAQGNAPAPAEVQVYADAAGMRRLRIYRESLNPVQTLASILYKEWEGGTLGAGTAGTADADAVGGNTAAVTYSYTAPSYQAIATASDASRIHTVAKPSGVVEGDVLVAFAWKIDSRSVLSTLDEGWTQVAVGRAWDGTGPTSGVLSAWIKRATAEDENTTTSYTWYSVFGDSNPWVVHMLRLQDVDLDQMVDVYTVDPTTTSTIATSDMTTTQTDDLIVLAIGARLGSGSISFTAPAGTTPTFTERADTACSADSKVGLETVTGLYSSQAATGVKTASVAGGTVSFGVAIMLAFRKTGSSVAERSRVTFTSIVPGDYDVFIRHKPTVACLERIRVSWALTASPLAWHDFTDHVCDTTAASSFDYVERYYGRLHVPEGHDEVTVKLSTGLDQEASSAVTDYDVVMLAPANERMGQLTASAQLAVNQSFVSDADADTAVVHDTDETILEMADVDGATLIELEPGVNVLWVQVLQDAPAAFDEYGSDLAANPILYLTHSPRYRT